MDPFTALGVASAVVQFVHFASTLISEGYEAVHSADGASQGDVTTQSLATHLEALCNRLAGSPPTNVRLSVEEYSIQALARQCRELANELSELLKSLTVTSQGLARGLESVRKAIQRAWKREKIDKLQEQLDRIKIQINTNLLKIIRDDQSLLTSAVNNLMSTNQKLHIVTQNQLAELRFDVLTALQQQASTFLALKRANRKRQKRPRRPGENAPVTASSSVEVVLSLNKLEAEGKRVAAEQRILQSLTFPEEPFRHAAIHEAHEKTFRWIFEADATPFKSWLDSESGIFWISGKAGSGKSTLMKFLAGHAYTQAALMSWAARNGKNLITAHFFFWNSGHPLQRTQEGLLQSLLAQVLRQSPHLITALVPERLASSCQVPWSRQELSTALMTLLTTEEGKLTTRFCFFIDGLDEYEGDHYELIRDLQDFARSSDVKFCVSSRPWTEFTDAFGQDNARFLTLQDLTRHDMDLFVRGLLGANPLFVELARREDRAQNLITEILARAEGVFLWVYLVVKSLLRGLAKHDNFRILEHRLNRLPTDLDKYYQHILQSIEDVYLVLSARTFQLMTQSEPIPLTVTLCLLEEMDDPQTVVRGNLGPHKYYEAGTSLQDATHNLNAWCRDLLAVHPDYYRRGTVHQCRIDFLHRTVKDFLCSQDVKNSLVQRIPPNLDPWLTLMRAFMYDAKKSSGLVEFFHTSGEIMHCAKQIETTRGETPATLLEDLDQTGCHYRTQQGGKLSHWTNAIESRNCNMLAYAVSFGLTVYVGRVLNKQKGRWNLRSRWRLLDFALDNRIRHNKLSQNAIPSLEMVKLLLDNGADMTHASRPPGHSNVTPWQRFLRRCHDTRQEDLWPVARLMLENGAKAGVKVEIARQPQVTRATGYERTGHLSGGIRENITYVSAEACLQRCCPNLEELASVFPLLEATRKATWRKAQTGTVLARIGSYFSWES